MTQNELSQSKRMHKHHKELAQHRVSHQFDSHHKQQYQQVQEYLQSLEVPYRTDCTGQHYVVSVDGNNAKALHDAVAQVS